jgi:hypothetical protein
MNSPANETAERWEFDDMWDVRRSDAEKAVLCSAVEFYSGMDAGRALKLYLETHDERDWDIKVERSS